MTELEIFHLYWRELVDIALVAFIFYRLILLVRGTRTASVFWGLLILVLIFYLSDVFSLLTLNWLLGEFLRSFFLIIVILFQRDIRKGLSQMATRPFMRRQVEDRDFTQLTAAVLSMAAKQIGALLVIEKSVPLGDIVERGVDISARISNELLQTIFHPDTPLHDGAVIIRGGKILAAGSILPLAVGVRARSEVGTRHRAAIGITQETDAIAVVVSEERGEISLAIGGKLTAPLDEVRLKRALKRAWEQ